MENMTPMIKQYQDIKSKFRDCILFFRLGDFYEMFGDDAQRACTILDVVLTSRDAGKSGRVPMCGIPYHAADSYISKLINAGLKVAICEQVEDPALAKGIVKREVIRVITSGTFIDETSFRSRHIICISFFDKKFGLAFTDTSSGAIFTNEYPDAQKLAQVLSKIQGYECVFPQAEGEIIKSIFSLPSLKLKELTLSPFEDWTFNVDIATKALLEHFRTHNLRGFAIDERPAAISASGALLEYLKQMNKMPMKHIDKISVYSDEKTVYVSAAACYGLELESLFENLDHTLTSMGKRSLRDWVYNPLKVPKEISDRQTAITLLKNEPFIHKELTKLLSNIPDIDKSISRISCGTAYAKDLLALRTALLRQPQIQDTLSKLLKENPLFALGDIPELRQLLSSSINPDIPLSNPEGKIINKGYDQDLDSLREILENGKNWLKDLQAQQIKRTGINSLKIGFNQVFGYYIEISRSNLDKVPADYIRRQTLANAERFITPELKSFEEKILTAEDKILQIEKRLLEEITKKILDYSCELHTLSSDLATIDCLQSLTTVSMQQGYIAPLITEETDIVIKDGRHPVVEKSLNEPFIPNDTNLNRGDDHMIILTGPNMSGKSTYIRQTAILVIMSQIGSYIPATEASIGIVDKVFTRIGAKDEITKGQSTFMVEMSETAGILNNLSERSLVILDEVGRGTSTFDGLSLAWAISEYLARAKTRTLFATHFHELTALAEEFPGVKNFNVLVREYNDEVIFMHKIVPGGTDESYGIYVAKLAGIPKDVVERSKKILARLEIHGNLQEKIRCRIPPEDQLSLFEDRSKEMLEQFKKEIQGLDLDKITPIEALNILGEIKKRLKDNG